MLGSHYQGALYRFPLLGIQAMLFPSVELAVARCAIDEVTALAHSKTPFATTTVLRDRRPRTRSGPRGSPVAGGTRAAVREPPCGVGRAAAGELLALQQRADLLLAMTQAVSGAATAVEWMWGVAGPAAFFGPAPWNAISGICRC